MRLVFDDVAIPTIGIIGVLFWLFALMSETHPGEIVECSASPPPPMRGVPWVYRDIDGRKCWFKAEPGMRRGSQKPLEELRWPMPAPDPVPVFAEEDDKPARWELEDRWHGERVEK